MAVDGVAEAVEVPVVAKAAAMRVRRVFMMIRCLG
jgi:hypothetical protein